MRAGCSERELDDLFHRVRVSAADIERSARRRANRLHDGVECVLDVQVIAPRCEVLDHDLPRLRIEDLRQDVRDQERAALAGPYRLVSLSVATRRP